MYLRGGGSAQYSFYGLTCRVFGVWQPVGIRIECLDGAGVLQACLDREVKQLGVWRIGEEHSF